MDAGLTKTAHPQSISDLKPHPRNPRVITPAAREALKASLDKFGDLGGICWNAQTRRLIAGHQRVAALREEHPDLQLDGGALVVPSTGDSYPIRVVDLSEEEELAAMVAANGVGGEWSEDLPELLQEIELQLPSDFEILGLADLDPQENISTNPTPDPAADLAQAIAQTQETLDAGNQVARITARVEAALTKRAEQDPAKFNNALLVILSNTKGAEAAILVDPCWSDAVAEIRRHYQDGASPIEALLARLFSFEPEAA